MAHLPQKLPGPHRHGKPLPLPPNHTCSKATPPLCGPQQPVRHQLLISFWGSHTRLWQGCSHMPSHSMQVSTGQILEWPHLSTLALMLPCDPHTAQCLMLMNGKLPSRACLKRPGSIQDPILKPPAWQRRSRWHPRRRCPGRMKVKMIWKLSLQLQQLQRHLLCVAYAPLGSPPSNPLQP